jgi:hypothetical protein
MMEGREPPDSIDVASASHMPELANYSSKVSCARKEDRKKL